MKTTVLKKEEIKRDWFIVDAKDKVLGKIATIIADKIRGKDKACFSPHMDCGDFVVVINADKVKLTGRKMTEKLYHRHSGYPGGYRYKTAEEMFAQKPTEVVKLAVSGMLPKNKLRQVFMQKLKLYAGTDHPHEAQQPKVLEV
jgi:large subunit ribosomal protein L13